MLNNPAFVGFLGMTILLVGIMVFKLIQQGVIYAVANILAKYVDEKTLAKIEADIKTGLRINEGIITINKINDESDNYYYETVSDARRTLEVFRVIRASKK